MNDKATERVITMWAQGDTAFDEEFGDLYILY